MTSAAALSIAAAALESLVGLLCVGFASAPGWAHHRRLAFLAFTASAYSLSNVPQTLTVAPSIIVPASHLSLAAAALHLFGWLRYSEAAFAGGGGRGALDRLLGGTLLGFAALGLVPGALARDTVNVHAVPWLGLRYATADATPLGGAAFVVLLAAMAVPAARFARAVRARAPGALPHLVGFAVLVATGVNEALTASQLIAAPYLMDVGILAATLTIGVELVRGVLAGTRAIADRANRLEQVVEERSADLARTRDALLQSDGLAALGRLAAGVVHEVNNPLSAIASNTTFLRDELASGAGEPRALGEVLGEISQAAERIRLVVRDLNVLGRGDEGAIAEVELAPVIDGAIRLARHEPGGGANVVVDVVGANTVLADRGRLARALVNLLVRAGHAQRSRGAVGPVRLRVRPEGREVRIEVEEEGPSAAPDDGAAARPGEAARQAAGGTGYSVAGSLIEAMGGRLEIEVVEGQGSRATLRLPACPRQFS